MLKIHTSLGPSYCSWEAMGGSLHSQVEHHVQDKFATPILYGIDNFEHYDIFSTYT